MTKQELVAALQALRELDPEQAHVEADALLIAYINDKEITEAYNAVEKWYA